MAACPAIASPNDDDVILSTYDRTNGVVVVIGCQGFGRHIDGPEVVTCNAGTWSQDPKTDCKIELDDRERVELGVGLACGLLALLVFAWLAWYVCCRRRRYQMYRDYIWRGGGTKPRYRETYYRREFNHAPRASFRRSRRFSDTDLPVINESRRSFRRSGRFNQADIRETRQSFRQSRRYSDPLPPVYTETQRIEPEIIRRETVVMPTYVEPRPLVETVIEKPIITYERQEPEVIFQNNPSYQVFTLNSRSDSQPVVSDTVYREPSFRKTKRSTYLQNDDVIRSSQYGVDNAGYRSDVKATLEPTIVDPMTIYVSYKTKGGGLRMSQSLPRAKIQELPDYPNDDMSVSTYNANRQQTGVANGGIDHSMNYFFGRQDYPYEGRSQMSGTKDLNHVLYHGLGKTTRIFEEESISGSKHRIIPRSDERL